MDPSKLNISAIAKEKIRKSFLSTFSLKRKKSEESDSSCTDSACTTEENSLKRVSCDEPCEPKMKQKTNHVPVPRLNEGVLFVGKDDGFPMITSVYSLATCDAHQGNGISSEVSSDHMSGEKAEARITAQSENARNDPTTTATPNLPFVVQCSNGVITVCSPPRVPGVATITNHTAASSCVSKQVTQTSDSTVQAAGTFGKPSNAASVPNTATPIASPVNKLPQHSVNDSQSSPSAIIPESPKCSIMPIVNQPSSLMKENQNSDAEGRFKVVYQRPILPKPDVSTPVVNSTEEESSTQLNEAEKHEEIENSPLNEEVTFTTTATAAAEAQADEVDEKAEEPPSPSTDHPVEEETQEPFLVTKQDDRIRRLKDLLHQQEEQLERVRFKGEGRTSGSPSSAQNLRVKLLRKNSGVGLHVPKAGTVIDAQSQGSISEPSTSTALSQDELGNSKEKQVELEKEPTRSTAHLSTPPSLLKRKNKPETPLSTSSHKQVTSPPLKRRNSATGSHQPKVPVNDQGNYRLVNVTVVHGHTRTLAVPVERKNEATTSKVQLKGTTAKSVQKVNKSVKTDKAGKSPRKVDGTSKALETTISTQNSSSNSSDVTKEHSNHLSNSKSDISPKDNSSTTVTQASTGSEFIPGVLSKKNASELGVAKKDVVPTTAIGNHPNQISNGNASNASKKANVTPTHQAGTQITAKPSVQNSATKQNIGTLKFPPTQTAGNLNLPSQGFTVNCSVPSSVGNNLNSFISQGSTVVTGFQLRSNPTKFSVPPTKTFPSNLPIVTPNVHTKNPNINIAGSTLVNSICATNQARPVSLNASTVQKEVATIAQIAYVPKTLTQGVTSVNKKGQAITGPSSRPIYLAPKPRSILNPGVKQNKFLIYSLPTTVVGAASPSAAVKLSNIPDGKLLICNVLPPKTTTKPGELPVSPPNNNGKMVFYVSNQGVGKKLGVIQDKRVLLSPTTKPCLAPKNLQVEVKGKSPVKSDSEFIPNPDDTDFTKLVGLEHVVCSLNTDR